MESARELFLSFPPRDFDASVYTRRIVSVLTKYPEWVVRRVCGEEGLVLTCNFLPSIREVNEACEKVLNPPREYMVTY